MNKNVKFAILSTLTILTLLAVSCGGGNTVPEPTMIQPGAEGEIEGAQADGGDDGGGGNNPPRAPRPTREAYGPEVIVPLGDGTTQFNDPVGLYTVTFPANWFPMDLALGKPSELALPQVPNASEQMIRSIQIWDNVTSNFQSSAVFNIFAFDFDEAHLHLLNVPTAYIQLQDSSSSSFDISIDLAMAIQVQQLEGIIAPEDFLSQLVKVNSQGISYGEIIVINRSIADKLHVDWQQKYVVYQLENGMVAIIVLTTEPENFVLASPTFDQMVNSFTFAP